jgi:hypothetical protein
MYGHFVIEEILKPTPEEGAKTPLRGCGAVKPGAIYLYGPLTEYSEPKPWSGDTFVGFRYYTEAT